MTPIGWPVQTIISSRTDHVVFSVFTFTQPLRSRPLKRSRKQVAGAADTRCSARTARAGAARMLRREVISRTVYRSFCLQRRRGDQTLVKMNSPGYPAARTAAERVQPH